jgi:hypothetical protein
VLVAVEVEHTLVVLLEQVDLEAEEMQERLQVTVLRLLQIQVVAVVGLVIILLMPQLLAVQAVQVLSSSPM